MFLLFCEIICRLKGARGTVNTYDYGMDTLPFIALRKVLMFGIFNTWTCFHAKFYLSVDYLFPFNMY